MFKDTYRNSASRELDPLSIVDVFTAVEIHVEFLCIVKLCSTVVGHRPLKDPC
jgi:hypothetical protein